MTSIRFLSQMSPRFIIALNATVGVYMPMFVPSTSYIVQINGNLKPEDMHS